MTKIKSLSSVDPDVVEQWFLYKKGRTAPVRAWAFKQFADELGLNWLGLYCMAIIETGYFTSQIMQTKNNLFGIGAVDSDPLGGAQKFDSLQHGIEAGAQHLAVYAGVEQVRQWPERKFIAKRSYQLVGWGYFGIIKEFSDLGGKDDGGRVKWASNPEHGKQVEKLIAEISAFKAPVKTPDAPSEPDKPAPRVPWRVIGTILKAVWPFVVKAFPWLGWATAIVYAIVEFLLK